MVSIKELLDELGGGRSLTLGAVVSILVYVAASRYVEDQAEWRRQVDRRIAELEAEAIRWRVFESTGPRFTDADGNELARRIERLERLEDERRKHHQ